MIDTDKPQVSAAPTSAREALERAAKICDEIKARATPICEANYTDGDSWVATCAAAIRALAASLPQAPTNTRETLEPDAYLVEFREISAAGQNRRVTMASLEPNPPTIFVEDKVETRELLRVTPLYALAAALPQGEEGVPEGYVPVPSTLTTRLRAVMDMFRYGGQPHAHLWGYLLAAAPAAKEKP